MRVLLGSLVALFLTGTLVPPPAGAQDSFAGVARIVAVGDVHGDFDRFVSILRAAGVVDAGNRWIGGKTHLVQTGDVFDRGPDSRKVIDLLMALEKPAAKAGGRVHALIGNHEVLNIIGDLRYVSAGEYASYRTPDSESLRDRAFDLLAEPARKNDPEYRQAWLAAHPLGWVEHRDAFAPNGTYGRWLRRRNAAVRINDVLFVHGGIGPKFADLSIGSINQRVRRELADLTRVQGGLVQNDDGPLWYRGLARGDEQQLAAHVDRVLAFHKARHIVIGHTNVAPAVLPRFNGKVVVIDVGLSALYGGPPACLVVEGGRLFALHRGQKLDLPQDGNLRPYLEEAAALDPPPSPLLDRIEELTPAVGQGQGPHTEADDSGA